MTTLFKILITLHIAGGMAGLISGTIATIVVKGKKAHRLCGKIFFYSMLTAGLSSLVISNLPGHKNVFLFAVGGFTLYMIMSGYRIVWLKKNISKAVNAFTWIDYVITLFALCFGVYLLFLAGRLIMAGYMFGIVPALFGFICLLFSFLDYRLYSGKVLVKYKWIPNHISRMIGALIASYTAFLVVNVHINMQWILWVLPTLVGGLLIRRFFKKYAPKTKKMVEQNIM